MWAKFASDFPRLCFWRGTCLKGQFFVLNPGATHVRPLERSIHGCHRRRRSAAVQPRSGADRARGPHLGRLQHLRDVDVRRALGRRLHLRGQPVLPRTDRMAGAARDAGRHHHRLLPDEPDRAPVAEIRHAVSGGRAHVVRRHGRQPRRDGARHRRHRLVRRADLFRLQGGPGAGLDVVSRRRACTHNNFFGLSTLGWVSFPVHVVLPAADLPERHGDHPQVHRFLRAGRLRGDVRAGDLDPGADRHVEPVAAAQSAAARPAQRSASWPMRRC